MLRTTKTLHGAARDGDVATVKELVVESGTDVNSKTYDQTPLHAAIGYFGEYAKSQGKLYSSESDHPQVVKTLLENKADPSQKDERGRPVIHVAALYGSSQILKILLEHKVNIEEREDDYNMTPLITAASSTIPKTEAEKRLQILLEHKAEVNQQDKHGRTALCQAVRNGFSAESVKALIDHKADVDRKEENDRTPLHYAARYDNPNLVKLLLEKKASVNQQDKQGRTPFYEVVNGAHPLWHSTAIKTLVEYKADVNQEDNEGDSPLDIALKKGHKQAEEIIKKTLSF